MDNEKKQLNDDQLAQVTGAGENGEELVHYIVRRIDVFTGAPLWEDEEYWVKLGVYVIITAQGFRNYSPLYEQMELTIQKDGEIIIFPYVPN